MHTDKQFLAGNSSSDPHDCSDSPSTHWSVSQRRLVNKNYSVCCCNWLRGDNSDSSFLLCHPAGHPLPPSLHFIMGESALAHQGSSPCSDLYLTVFSQPSSRCARGALGPHCSTVSWAPHTAGWLILPDVAIPSSAC